MPAVFTLRTSSPTIEVVAIDTGPVVASTTVRFFSGTTDGTVASSTDTATAAAEEVVVAAAPAVPPSSPLLVVVFFEWSEMAMGVSMICIIELLLLLRRMPVATDGT